MKLMLVLAHRTIDRSDAPHVAYLGGDADAGNRAAETAIGGGVFVLADRYPLDQPLTTFADAETVDRVARAAAQAAAAAVVRAEAQTERARDREETARAEAASAAAAAEEASMARSPRKKSVGKRSSDAPSAEEAPPAAS